MSSSERHRRSKRLKTLCAACQARKARFRYRRQVRADRDHTLCFECYRGELNRARACRADGYVGAPSAADREWLARTTDVRVLLTPSGWRRDVETIATRIDDLPELGPR